jgi:hypothetical protein
MAAITISSPGGAKINPTGGFLPYNNNGVFSDSMAYMSDTNIFNIMAFEGSDEVNGLKIDNAIGRYEFGDTQGFYHNSNILIDENDYDVKLISSGSVFMEFLENGRLVMSGTECIKATAGAPILNKFLFLNINGDNYKIALLNP